MARLVSSALRRTWPGGVPGGNDVLYGGSSRVYDAGNCHLNSFGWMCQI
jgi:hypothetical protein